MMGFWYGCKLQLVTVNMARPNMRWQQVAGEGGGWVVWAGDCVAGQQGNDGEVGFTTACIQSIVHEMSMDI